VILVDYHCAECGGRFEHLVRNPVPASVDCPACRAPARRRFSPVGLVGRAAAPPSSAPTRPRAGRRALCQDNPDVPGLCHMTEDAGRMWVARARKDNRSLDRELERQERARSDHPGVVPEPVSHDHGTGRHSHGSGPGHNHGPGRSPAPGGADGRDAGGSSGAGGAAGTPVHRPGG
jgi:putative FmdB family regulatory protein